MEIEGLVDASLRAVFIGVVAWVAYLFQKRIERRTEKRDLAEIMLHEVINLIQIHRQIARKHPMPPSAKVYDGLLHTGNIRYFSEAIRVDLGRIYENFDSDNIKPPDETHEQVLKGLEDMRRSNMEIRRLVPLFLVSKMSVVWKLKRSRR